MSKLEMSGAQIVARTLKACGVKYFFCMSGGMHQIFFELQNEGIEVILARNEKTAANMADGYARMSRRPTTCYSQHGSAAAILSSMLYEPMFCHSPVLALTGSTPLGVKDTWRYQEVDEMPYFEPTCKFNADVTDLNRLSEYLRRSIQIAMTGCPGPVHVNIHNDMDKKVVKSKPISADKSYWTIPPFRPRAEPQRVTEAAKLLSKSDNPILICGSGVALSGAYDEVRQLAELLTIPVVTNTKGKGCFPEDHPLYVGVVGDYGTTLANKVVREADVVFFVGTRAETHMTEERTAPMPGASKIIHLDIDPTVFGVNYRADVPLLGDAKSTLTDLISAIRSMVAHPKPNEHRIRRLSRAIEEYARLVKPLVDSDSVPTKPQRVMKELSLFLRKQDIVVSDTGQQLCWTSRFLKLRAPGTFIGCGGTLGSSFGLAIGVSFAASKSQRIVNVIGDGGIAYNLTDLETLKRYGNKHAPFVSLILDNSSLSQGRIFDEDWNKKEAPAYNHIELSNLDYAKIAESFRCYGIRVDRPEDVQEALETAFNSGKPAFVDVTTDKREYPPITVHPNQPRKHAPWTPEY